MAVDEQPQPVLHEQHALVGHQVTGAGAQLRLGTPPRLLGAAARPERGDVGRLDDQRPEQPVVAVVAHVGQVLQQAHLAGAAGGRGRRQRLVGVPPVLDPVLPVVSERVPVALDDPAAVLLVAAVAVVAGQRGDRAVAVDPDERPVVGHHVVAQQAGVQRHPGADGPAVRPAEVVDVLERQHRRRRLDAEPRQARVLLVVGPAHLVDQEQPHPLAAAGPQDQRFAGLVHGRGPPLAAVAARRRARPRRYAAWW